MLTREITYTDYNGNEQTEKFYFNVTQPELIEMEVEHKMGFQQHLETIIASDDRKALIREFKALILLAYGEKSSDGKHFVKSEELTRAFTHHPAYSILFMELATDHNAAAAFITGIVPKEMAGEIEKQVASEMPPPPPVA